MLDRVFMQILDMSKTGSIVILVVLLARLLLKKAPKTISYALWAVVLLRLLCPVGIEAPVSIVPQTTSVSENYTLEDMPISVAGAGIAAYQAVGDVLNGGIDIQHIPTTNIDEVGNVEYVTANWSEVWILFGQYIWVAGVAGMILYSIVSYWKLKKQLSVKMLLRDNIYIADDIDSPFVIGFIKPKIYLPATLTEQEQSYIIAHEQHHIRRYDHIIKVMAFAALILHWMNPLAWLAFVLASRDMEMSCDEAVVRKLGEEIRSDYAASLLSLATGKRVIAGAPLAFGEGDPKDRIKNLSKWKKPVAWVTGITTVLCVVLAVCLLTDRKSDDADKTWYYGTVCDRAMSVIEEGSIVSRPYLSITQEDGVGVQFWIDKGYDVPEGIAIGDYVKVLGSVEAKNGLLIAHHVELLDPITDDEEQRYKDQWEELKRKEEELRQEAEAAKQTEGAEPTKNTEPTVPAEYAIPEGIAGVVTYAKMLEEIDADNYTPQQAAADGCVVMIGGDAVANENIWIQYTVVTSRWEAAKVRLAEYDNSGNLKRLYELVWHKRGHIYRLLKKGSVEEKFYKYLALNADGDYDGGHYNMFQVYALTNQAVWRFDKGVPYDDSTWDDGAVMAFCNLYQRYDYAPIPQRLQCAEICDQNGTVAVIWDHQKLEELVEILGAAPGDKGWPKTIELGATLVLTGTDGKTVEAAMMRYYPMIEINGVFYNYDPGWEDVYTVESVLSLFGLSEMP